MKKVTFIKSVKLPISKFIKSEYTGSAVLFLSVISALVWANSQWSDSYHHFWENEFTIGFESYKLKKSLHHWINDGLMSMFFFVAGLELKREFIAGELSSINKSILPIAAALGGMIVPALFYALVNGGNHHTSSGWGIPMATDIAFALGVLALVNKNVPLSLKVFLTALAIVDDLGAVVVIAFFYTSEISVENLSMGIFFLVILLGANAAGVRNTIFYAIVGIGGVWIAFMLSGIHATIAGVLAAMTIPARTAIDEKGFASKLKYLTGKFELADPNKKVLLTAEQMHLIEEIKTLSSSASTPLQKLEHTLHPLIVFVIMPVFALANSGIELSFSELSETLFKPVSVGIILGLFAGKFIGIISISKLMVKLKIGHLPENTTWKHMYGVAFLAGIGFTMSLFVTQLAFDNEQLINQAKTGIVFSSLISGIIGYYILKSIKPKKSTR